MNRASKSQRDKYPLESPDLPPYRPAPDSREKLKFASVRTVSLAGFDSPDLAVRNDAFDSFKMALVQDGYLHLVDHGISQARLERQFGITQGIFQPGAITDQEKEHLRIDMEGTGRFAGYKPKGLKQLSNDIRDNYEEFNYYSDAFVDATLSPKWIHKYLPEIQDFIHSVLHVVHPKLLIVISRMLELPDDYLASHVADRNHTKGLGESYYHQMVYHPRSVEEQKRSTGVAFAGHKDFCLITYLISQPICGLQVLDEYGEWLNVKHIPGALIVNLGEVSEFISGGILRATQHRVADPPSDQLKYPRYTLAIFANPRSDVSLAPIMQSPLIQRHGPSKGAKTLLEGEVSVFHQTDSRPRYDFAVGTIGRKLPKAADKGLRGNDREDSVFVRGGGYRRERFRDAAV